MEIPYLTAIGRYYKLLTFIVGSNKTKKKKPSISISGKISKVRIIIYMFASIFFVLIAMGTDSINIVEEYKVEQ